MKSTKRINRVAVLIGLIVGKRAFLLLAFAVATLLIASTNSNAQMLGGTLVRTASLPGTVTNAGNYFVEKTPDGWKPARFEVTVSNVKLPTDTALGVFLNSNQVGTIRITSTGSGFLRLSVKLGHTVPTVPDGALLSVRNGATTILSGTFKTLNEADKGCDD